MAIMGDPKRLRVADKPRGEALKQYPEGRRCHRCGAKLSIYNSADVCQPCWRKQNPQPKSPLTGGQSKGIR